MLISQTCLTAVAATGFMLCAAPVASADQNMYLNELQGKLFVSLTNNQALHLHGHAWHEVREDQRTEHRTGLIPVGISLPDHRLVAGSALGQLVGHAVKHVVVGLATRPTEVVSPFDQQLVDAAQGRCCRWLEVQHLPQLL